MTETVVRKLSSQNAVIDKAHKPIKYFINSGTENMYYFKEKALGQFEFDGSNMLKKHRGRPMFTAVCQFS